jgi:shikimate dehydrogenase
MPTLCGSLSLHPVSLGAGMHTAGYRALGLDFVYVPFRVNGADLERALSGMRALGIRGFGVSYPHKLAVIPLLDEVAPVARRIGAVNTVVNDDGHLKGHNTDWIGAVRAIEEVRPLGGAGVLVLGAGGAARAVAFGLRERGARVVIANRDVAKAEALAREVGGVPASLGDGSAIVAHAAQSEIVVNATTRGMAGADPSSPLPSEALSSAHLVMDLVYKPIETELLRQARARGATVVHGGRMLLHQAAEQFELYTGHPAPLEAMDSALRAAIG